MQSIIILACLLQHLLLPYKMMLFSRWYCYPWQTFFFNPCSPSRLIRLQIITWYVNRNSKTQNNRLDLLGISGISTWDLQVEGPKGICGRHFWTVWFSVLNTLQAEMTRKQFENLSPAILKQVLPLVEQLPPLYMDLANGREDFCPKPEETQRLVNLVSIFSIFVTFLLSVHLYAF